MSERKSQGHLLCPKNDPQPIFSDRNHLEFRWIPSSSVFSTQGKKQTRATAQVQLVAAWTGDHQEIRHDPRIPPFTYTHWQAIRSQWFYTDERSRVLGPRCYRRGKENQNENDLAEDWRRKHHVLERYAVFENKERTTEGVHRRHRGRVDAQTPP